jgi:hypothetical protein
MPIKKKSMLSSTLAESAKTGKPSANAVKAKALTKKVATEKVLTAKPIGT